MSLRPNQLIRYPIKHLLSIPEERSIDGNTSGDLNDGSTSFLKQIRNRLKRKPSDALTTRQRLAKMGLSALLSYGFVSNMSLCVTVSLAWFSFSKKVGLLCPCLYVNISHSSSSFMPMIQFLYKYTHQFGKSPLAPGEWKGFLALYAGFYVFNNIVRPIRVAVSVAISPYFENAIQYIQTKTNMSRPLSITLVVFLANVCGTLSFMSAGIYASSKLAGVPVFPPK